MRIAKVAMMVVAGVFAVAASAVHAEVRGIMSIGYDLGGDNILEVGFTNGSTATINAGEGIYIDGGVIAPLNEDKSLQMALTGGLKYKAITASNGDAVFMRFPIEAKLLYKLGNHRLGAGAAYHANTTLVGTGVLSDLDESFDSNVGVVAQYDYRLGLVSVGAKYTNITYHHKALNHDFKASSTGLFVTFNF